MGEEAKKPAAEEEKKPEQPKKVEEEKKEEKPAEKPATEEKKPEEIKKESPPAPQEIVLKVYMHCEGCARKVRRWLKGFEGVEDVTTDCKAGKVVVKGEKADPLKVLERIQRKSHRQVVLISPIPKPPSEEKKKAEEKEKPKVEEKKEKPPVIIAMLRVHMHCEACALGIKKRIQRMQGVESAEPDLKSSQVIVKGVFEPQQLVEYVYKRTRKHAEIVKQEPEKKEAEKGKESKEEKGKESKEGKKGEEGDKPKKGGGGGEQGEGKDKKEGGGSEAKAAAPPPAEETTEETTVVELRKMDFYNYYSPTSYEHYSPTSYEHYSPPPQIFSDENPNACSVM